MVVAGGASRNEPPRDCCRLRSSLGFVELACLSRVGVGHDVLVDSFILDRCSHPEGAVASLTVVEHFEVFEDGVGEFDAGVPPSPVQEFDLHPGPERFDHGVIEALTG